MMCSYMAHFSKLLPAKAKVGKSGGKVFLQKLREEFFNFLCKLNVFYTGQCHCKNVYFAEEIRLNATLINLSHLPPKFLQKKSPTFLHCAFATSFIRCRRPWLYFYICVFWVVFNWCVFCILNLSTYYFSRKSIENGIVYPNCAELPFCAFTYFDVRPQIYSPIYSGP